jgi:hypothetical protein
MYISLKSEMHQSITGVEKVNKLNIKTTLNQT